MAFAGVSVPTPIKGEFSSVVAVITPDATILVVSSCDVIVTPIPDVCNFLFPK